MLLAVVAVERSLDAVFVCVDVAIRIVGVALRYRTSLQQLYHAAAPVVKVGFGIFCAFCMNTSNEMLCDDSDFVVIALFALQNSRHASGFGGMA